MRHDLDGTASRQVNLAAAALLAAVLTQLLLAQLTLALAACLVLTGRLVRWRPIWLAVPAAAGLALVLSVGPARSIAGYLAIGADLARHLGARGPAQARVAGLGGVLWRWDRWLPRQLPVVPQRRRGPGPPPVPDHDAAPRGGVHGRRRLRGSRAGHGQARDDLLAGGRGRGAVHWPGPGRRHRDRPGARHRGHPTSQDGDGNRPRLRRPGWAGRPDRHGLRRLRRAAGSHIAVGRARRR